MPLQSPITFDIGSVADIPFIYSGTVTDPWIITTAKFQSGTKSLKAPTVPHSLEQYVPATARASLLGVSCNAGTFSFNYYKSSETGYDFFNFYLDGVQVLHESGDGGWYHVTWELTEGAHDFAWEYAKDFSESMFDDTVYIDDIIIPLKPTNGAIGGGTGNPHTRGSQIAVGGALAGGTAFPLRSGGAEGGGSTKVKFGRKVVSTGGGIFGGTSAPGGRHTFIATGGALGGGTGNIRTNTYGRRKTIALLSGFGLSKIAASVNSMTWASNSALSIVCDVSHPLVKSTASMNDFMLGYRKGMSVDLMPTAVQKSLSISNTFAIGYSKITAISTGSSLLNKGFASTNDLMTGFSKQLSSDIGSSNEMKHMAFQLDMVNGYDSTMSLVNDIGTGYHKVASSSVEFAMGVHTTIAGLVSVGGAGLYKSVALINSVDKYFTTNSSVSYDIGFGGISKAQSVVTFITNDSAKYLTSKMSVDGGVYTVSLATMVESPDRISVNAASRLTLSDVPNISAPYDCRILIDDMDVTKRITQCKMTWKESEIYDTITVEFSDVELRSILDSPYSITVEFPDVTHVFLVEEVSGEGITRTFWGRPETSSFSDPFASIGLWNNVNMDLENNFATELCVEVMSKYPVDWKLDDWVLPPRFELNDTPIQALSTLIKPIDGIIDASSILNKITRMVPITVRKRWPVRPIELSKVSPTDLLEINRDAVIEMTINDSQTVKYGRVIVSGFNGDTELPSFEVEGTPSIGLPATVRLYWPGPEHPVFDSFITDGKATLLGTVTEVLTETVTFSDFTGRTTKPIWELLEFAWEGHDSGDIWWLENGYSTELEITDPLKYGVAKVTYSTVYERWELDGQDVETVMFGVLVSSSAISADVSFTSGGAHMGEIKEPLLYDLPVCAISGTAKLDNTSVRFIANATIPRIKHVPTGKTVVIDDELIGLMGFGKVSSVETVIDPGKITQKLEIQVC